MGGSGRSGWSGASAALSTRHLLTAVSVVDVLLGRDLTSVIQLEAQVHRYAGRQGWRRAERVFGLADAGAQSPPESALRVRFVLAGLAELTVAGPKRSTPDQGSRALTTR